jgi:hypothetical protein
MATKVGEVLKHDPLKLRFTQSNGQNGCPKSIIRRQGSLTVAELIQPGYMATTNNLLYYELLDVSIIELETKKSLRITWVGPNNKEDVSLVPSLFGDVLEWGAHACPFWFPGLAFVPATEEHDNERRRAGLVAQGGQAAAGRLGRDSHL